MNHVIVKTPYSLTEAYFYIKNNKITSRKLSIMYGIAYHEAVELKKIAKEINLKQFEIKTGNLLVELGYQNEPCYSEKEMIEGYIPCSYEELIKEYND